VTEIQEKIKFGGGIGTGRGKGKGENCRRFGYQDFRCGALSGQLSWANPSARKKPDKVFSLQLEKLSDTYLERAPTGVLALYKGLHQAKRSAKHKGGRIDRRVMNGGKGKELAPGRAGGEIRVGKECNDPSPVNSCRAVGAQAQARKD